MSDVAIPVWAVEVTCTAFKSVLVLVQGNRTVGPDE